MSNKNMKAGKLLRLFLLFLLLSMGMPVHVQAKTKPVAMTVGQERQLSVKKTWKKVRWKTSKPEIASVSSKGKVTAKKAGKAVITAKSGTKKKKFLITVKKSRIKIVIGRKTFMADMENNRTARAFMRLLPATWRMEELNGNEKYCYIDQTLPADAKKPGTIRAGDIMLYGDDCLVLFYRTFRSSYSYTKIGHISRINDLEDILGTGNIKVSLRP